MNIIDTNIGKNLADNIQATSSSSFPLPTINEETMYLYPTNRTEILNLIYNIKLKAGGIVGMSTKTLKTLAELIADPLVHIISKSIELAIWP